MKTLEVGADAGEDAAQVVQYMGIARLATLSDGGYLAPLSSYLSSIARMTMFTCW